MVMEPLLVKEMLIIAGSGKGPVVEADYLDVFLPAPGICDPHLPGLFRAVSSHCSYVPTCVDKGILDSQGLNNICCLVYYIPLCYSVKADLHSILFKPDAFLIQVDHIRINKRHFFVDLPRGWRYVAFCKGFPVKFQKGKDRNIKGASADIMKISRLMKDCGHFRRYIPENALLV